MTVCFLLESIFLVGTFTVYIHGASHSDYPTQGHSVTLSQQQSGNKLDVQQYKIS